MQLGWKKLYPAPTRFVPDRVPHREYLDDSGLDPELRRKSYADLEDVARLPFQFSPIWTVCERLLTGGKARQLAASGAGRPWKLLELGAGTGHLAGRIEALARKRGLDVRVIATDREPVNGRTVRLDWLHDDLPECDVVYSNLVLHHFGQEESIRALSRMNGAARLGGVIYDLNRSRLTFEFLRWTFPFLARSPVTVADALISVQQAFRPEELRRAAEKAGILEPQVSVVGLVRTRLWWEKA